VICIELSFTADPARLAARSAHRDVLRELHAAGELVAAGPWSDDSGALLVLDVDRARADEIIAADPYYRTPGVQVTTVRAWQPVVGPGA
jgi:uncharacterized protein